MDIGFNWTRRLPALDMSPHGEGWAGTPDWHALRSRLGTAWLARQAFAAPAGEAILRIGSFAPSAAEALGGFGETLRSVNRTASGNCKSGGAIDMADAGISLAGARGLI